MRAPPGGPFWWRRHAERLRGVIVVSVHARSAPRFGYIRNEFAADAIALLLRAINVPIDRYWYERVDAFDDVVAQWPLRQPLDVDRRRVSVESIVGRKVPDLESSVINVGFEAVAVKAEPQVPVQPANHVVSAAGRN